jgi:hypothetical protein
LAGLLDLLKDGETGGFKFRDGDFFHGRTPSDGKGNTRIDYSQTIVQP